MSTPATIVIASLNLWGFNNWEKRFPVILETLGRLDPDIIFTQQTQSDPAFSDKDQTELLNAELRYPYAYFAPIETLLVRKGITLPFPVKEGLGVLSKFSFEIEIVPLLQALDDRHQRALLYCKVDIADTKHHLTNIHYSNSDAWAEKHFKETIAMLKETGTKSILVGDFNIYNIEKYKKIYGNDYVSSSELYEYISYPEDGASLDYILLPNGYSFKDFDCRSELVSDHAMITAEINLPS